MATTRIYACTQAGKTRLIRATNPAVARSHIAKDTIIVSVASPDDTYELALQGVKVEDIVTGPVQMEIGEQE
jgi:mannose/fructose/N-acetylgalactosamine-specific phosphotransferase system component IIB